MVGTQTQHGRSERETIDTVIPEGPEVLSEWQKRQVSEHSAFNVIAFVFICRCRMYAIHVIQDGCIFALVNNVIETLKASPK